MKPTLLKTLVLVILICMTDGSLEKAWGQNRTRGPWWPSKLWGADDQSGASNWITPEKVLKAVTLLKTG